MRLVRCDWSIGCGKGWDENDGMCLVDCCWFNGGGNG